ncbi:MAG: DUF2752 domain-containing protein [Oscillibacter sp.]|nr:DUF2752 domain-containing protein [Oscillibacter sp.]
MPRGPITDREAYPAAWLTLAALALGYFLWRFAWHAPALSACWFYTRWHVYCPGCGGTRALLALLGGHPLRSLYYHPAVLFAAGSVFLYLGSQTVWRLRGRRGWALHCSAAWFRWMAALLLLNCMLRNVLWFGFGIPL